MRVMWRYFKPRKTGAEMHLGSGIGPESMCDSRVVNVRIPTHNDKVMGNDRWGLGPSIVVLYIDNHWVYGALANNLWSVSSSHSDPIYNNFLMQPFINYNYPCGL